MNMTASLFFALTLVGGSIDPGAPIESPSGVTIAATFILPEPPPPPGSNQDSTEFSTTPISAVLPGAVILREPFLDIDPKETFSIWSDVVIFRSDDQGNFFADLYSSVRPTPNQQGFITADGTTIALPPPASRKFINEATSGTYTVYTATSSAGTNTYLIESVSPVPEPSGLLLLSFGLSAVMGVAWHRHRAVQ